MKSASATTPSPDEDALSNEVVVGVAGDVVLRHRLDDPHAVGDETRNGREQQIVEMAKEVTGIRDERAPAAGWSLPDARLDGHQSESFVMISVAGVWKYSSSTLSAVGAATAPP